MRGFTTWYGAFLVDGESVVRSFEVPQEPAQLAERMRVRADGGRTAEENALLEAARGSTIEVGDRRLAGEGAVYVAGLGLPRAVADRAPEIEILRTSALLEAERRLAQSWDPSIHLEEAVRATADLDRAMNLLGERLESWAQREGTAPEDAGEEGGSGATTPGDGAPAPALPAPDPELLRGRTELKESVRRLAEIRRDLERSVEAAVARRAPNLSALLGPGLAARLIAQAGGLDRLSRLPASTVQVLGAERAFFEHLRGRAPPPRHGLLFLHPKLQGSPRRLRGKLARALAGKAAIAARIDRGGGALDPDLLRGFEARAAAVRALPPRDRPRRGRRLRPPLHRAAEDR